MKFYHNLTLYKLILCKKINFSFKTDILRKLKIDDLLNYFGWFVK